MKSEVTPYRSYGLDCRSSIFVSDRTTSPFGHHFTTLLKNLNNFLKREFFEWTLLPSSITCSSCFPIQPIPPINGRQSIGIAAAFPLWEKAQILILRTGVSLYIRNDIPRCFLFKIISLLTIEFKFVSVEFFVFAAKHPRHVKATVAIGFVYKRLTDIAKLRLTVAMTMSFAIVVLEHGLARAK